MVELARRHATSHEVDPTTRRALNQAARELALAQSSDWAFQMSASSAREYATRRTDVHVARFDRLYREISDGSIDAEWLAEIEKRDAIFEEMDFAVYR